MSVQDNIPIGIAVPIYTPGVNLKLCSIEEFQCWFDSCLLSPQINGFINKAMITKHFSQRKHTHGITNHILSILRDMSIDKYTRQSVMKNIGKTSSERMKWILPLSMIITMVKRIEQQNTFNNIKKLVVTGMYNKSDTRNYLYNALIPHIFEYGFENLIPLFWHDKKGTKIIIRFSTAVTISSTLPLCQIFLTSPDAPGFLFA